MSKLPKYYYFVIPGTTTMNCVKRGHLGFHPNLTKPFPNESEATRTAEAMNMMVQKEYKVLHTPDTHDRMIRGAMFGWGR